MSRVLKIRVLWLYDYSSLWKTFVYIRFVYIRFVYIRPYVNTMKILIFFNLMSTPNLCILLQQASVIVLKSLGKYLSLFKTNPFFFSFLQIYYLFSSLFYLFIFLTYKIKHQAVERLQRTHDSECPTTPQKSSCIELLL